MQYLGSKNRIAKELVPAIQKYIDDNNIKTYIEPFVGGANVIDKIKCERKIGYVINKYLIALLEQVKENVDILPEIVTEEEYKKVKNNKEMYADWYVGFVGFCSSFGAKFFNGYARNGRKEEYVAEAKRNLVKQAPNLKDIEFICNDYKNSTDNLLQKALIYCDPPYRGTTKYNNTIDYDEFYDWCVYQEKICGNIVLISEYNMPQDRFECIWQKEHNTNFASTRTTSEPRIEKLFVVKQ